MKTTLNHKSVPQNGFPKERGNHRNIKSIPNKKIVKRPIKFNKGDYSG